MAINFPASPNQEVYEVEDTYIFRQVYDYLDNYLEFQYEDLEFHYFELFRMAFCCCHCTALQQSTILEEVASTVEHSEYDIR